MPQAGLHRVFCEFVSVQASEKPLLRVLANNGNGSDELPELQDPGLRFAAVAVCSGLKTTALGPPIAYFCLPLSGLCSQETSGFHPACFGPVKYSSKQWPLWRFSLACGTIRLAKGSQSSVVMTEFCHPFVRGFFLLGHQPFLKSWHTDFLLVMNARPILDLFLASSFHLN